MNTFEIVASVIAAVAGAAAGAYITSWLQRSKPWVELISIDRDDRFLIEVPEEILALSNQCHWISPIIEKKLPLYRLEELSAGVQNLIPLLKEALELSQHFEKMLGNEDFTIGEKKEKFTSLIRNNIIMGSLRGMIYRAEIPLLSTTHIQDLTQNKLPVISAELFLDPKLYMNKGILIWTEKGSLYINVGETISGHIINSAVSLGYTLLYFLETELQKIISHLNNEIEGDLRSLFEMQKLLVDALWGGKLIIKAQIANLGATPEHIEPYGILKIRSEGTRIDPILVSISDVRIYEAGSEELPAMMSYIEGLARKQGVETARTPRSIREIPEYVTIKPGDSAIIELVPQDSIQKSVFEALQSGYLPCRLILKRAGTKKRKPFIASHELVMGLTLTEKKRRELEQESAKYSAS